MPLLDNLLKVRCEADRLIPIHSVGDLQRALDEAGSLENLTVLGGTSNLVPLARLRGVTCVMLNRGVSLAAQTQESCDLTVAAGENWHALVKRTVGSGWYGLENLALIPGSVGAAPVQNIGAYGGELRNVLVSVRALDTSTGLEVDLDLEQCRFGYRDSTFKTDEGRHYIVLALTLRLHRTPHLQRSYPDIVLDLAARGGPVTPRRIMEAVIRIRRGKLPDPRWQPNVGSFFKNPVVDEDTAGRLLEQNLHRWATPEGDKFSAAQLIEKTGFKGVQRYGVRTWHRQPLVLVNTGTTSGADFLRYAQEIAAAVAARYQLTLEIEPTVIGQDE